MAERLRWGILGTGNIARQFSAGVNASKRGRLAAVASRSADSAAGFAKAHSVPRFYGSYGELLMDGDVDAVYVSLPNSLHHEWAVLALQAGKHVLCEKPLASNAAESEQMFDEAGRAGWSWKPSCTAAIRRRWRWYRPSGAARSGNSSSSAPASATGRLE